MTDREDLVYRVLSETARNTAPDISIQLLQKIYEVQVEHQFDKDRQAAIDKMRACILSEIDTPAK